MADSFEVEPPLAAVVDSPYPWAGRLAGALLVLAALSITGCFGTWIEFHTKFGEGSSSTTISTGGITSGASPGWPTLLISAIAVVVVALTFKRGVALLRIAVAPLYLAIMFNTGYYCVYYSFFGSSPVVSFSVGWGLWLCALSGLAGTALAIVWFAQGLQRWRNVLEVDEQRAPRGSPTRHAAW